MDLFQEHLQLLKKYAKLANDGTLEPHIDIPALVWIKKMCYSLFVRVTDAIQGPLDMPDPMLQLKKPSSIKVAVKVTGAFSSEYALLDKLVCDQTTPKHIACVHNMTLQWNPRVCKFTSVSPKTILVVLEHVTRLKFHCTPNGQLGFSAIVQDPLGRDVIQPLVAVRNLLRAQGLDADSQIEDITCRWTYRLLFANPIKMAKNKGGAQSSSSNPVVPSQLTYEGCTISIADNRLTLEASSISKCYEAYVWFCKMCDENRPTDEVDSRYFETEYTEW